MIHAHQLDLKSVATLIAEANDVVTSATRTARLTGTERRR
jgi:hypothetical protein